MKALIIYIITFFVLLFAFFTENKEETQFESLEGTFFNTFVSTQTLVSERTTEIVLFKNHTPQISSELPTYSIFGDLPLPDKFVGRVVDNKHDADYILISTVSMPVTPPVSKREKTDKSKKGKQAKTVSPESKQQKPTLVSVVKKEEKEISYNYYILNNIVKNSSKTYFFQDKEQTLRNVTVKIYSISPWQDKDIIKFQITNAQREYFFIANLSLYEDTELVTAEFYNESLIAPEKTLDGIVVVPRQQQKQLTLKLIESADREGSFAVAFDTP